MIAIKKLSKYFGKRVIFDDLNLSFDKGKIYALIGESGSGKTTLLNILAKLETYDSGSVTYDGTDLKEINLKSIIVIIWVICSKTLGLLKMIV